VSEKLSKAPVYYALAQAQFNPIELMAKFIPEVQDSFRLRGYTFFEPQQGMQLQIVQAIDQAPAQPQLVPATNWLMTHENRTSGFILGTSFLTFHTTHYETGTKFISEFLDGLKALNEVVGLAHLSRLGMRYLDAVLPSEGESVDQYLVPGLHGISLKAHRRYSLNESVYETTSGPLLSSGMLIARLYRVDSAVGYPPDLAPPSLVPKAGFQSASAVVHGMIDTDHSVTGQMTMDFDKISEQLLSLRKTLKGAFNATITDHARDVWA
jgi:uncharacterized protein (TIGR04255 family)